MEKAAEVPKQSTARHLAAPQVAPGSTNTPDEVKLDLTPVLTKSGLHLDTLELRAYIMEIVAFGGTARRAADALGVNSGLFTQVIEYRQDSPTLRRVLKTPKHERRPRLCIETDPTQYDKQAAAHGMNRAEFLAHVLKVDRELAEMGDGFGELEY